ncbi:hypothetical protein [Sporosarcina sp. G11-34]|uniref:hypothetical protein n=1 Tax=Sporosarcina sp. G11-34 TaxID=2849605 RepID=UPI0022A99AF8|nr:hypothetical protein [Sporosarcina sp. G11-34]MCZ2258588.1 hypothetical protein [Sporosarcina sp. G11-34]
MTDDRNELPTGHERSYRRGYADAISKDRRETNDSERPVDLPHGHGKSYDKGYNDGKKH